MADKPIVWLQGEVKTPPFSTDARVKAGFLLRELQAGEMLRMPESRPMPTIGRNCHELRVIDAGTDKTWRIIYRIDKDAIIIAEVFAKKTQKTPSKIIDVCKSRLKNYDSLIKD
jgi:phage-related protein